MEYKGVKIFVTNEGEFYCNAVTNSADYNNKQFKSLKFTSIQKAIDNFEGAKTNKLWFKFESYYCKIKKYKQVSSKGDLMIFSDGTDSSGNCKYLISEDNLNKKSLEKAEELSKKYLELDKKILELNREKQQLTYKFEELKFIL